MYHIVIFSVHTEANVHNSSAVFPLTFNWSSLSFPPLLSFIVFLPALYTMSSPRATNNMNSTQLLELFNINFLSIVTDRLLFNDVSGYFQGDVLILNYNSFLKDL